MAKIIALTNHKGGCGKTTSCINLGAALAAMGHKCLIVDLDPQSNLTQSLGLDPSSVECRNNVYTALELEQPLQPQQTTTNRLDIVPSSKDLAGMEVALGSRDRKAIKQLLEPMRDKYKYILLDCPPALGLLTINALAAADAAVLPLQAQYLALQGLTSIQSFISDIQQQLNPALKLAGVFITQYDGRKVLHKNVDHLAEVMLQQTLCKTKIRDNIALAEAPAMGKTIFEYEPRSKGAEDYRNLAKELVKRCSQ